MSLSVENGADLLREGDFVIYLCPGCGRTIKWPKVYYASPNLTCTCRFPACVYQMALVWPKGLNG